MAIQTIGVGYAFVGEKDITVGDLTGLTSKTVTTILPAYLDSTMVPVVTSADLSDFGVGIGNAWFSTPVPGTGTTLNIKLYNIGLATSLSGDPVTFKIVVL